MALSAVLCQLNGCYANGFFFVYQNRLTPAGTGGEKKIAIAASSVAQYDKKTYKRERHICVRHE